jgi:two-component system LytT family sensor kinase
MVVVAPMKFWQSSSTSLFARPTADEWRMLRIQMLILFGLSTLLYIGFPGTREWRRLAEERHIQTIIRGWDGLGWYTWLAAAPFMLMLVRRFPLVRDRAWDNLARLLGGSLLVYLAVTHVRYGFRMLPDVLGGLSWAEVTDFDTYAYNTFGMLPLDLLTCSGFFAVTLAIDSYYSRRQHATHAMHLQLKAAQLQGELARAELAALRGQLHPHFLFNSFNALATLVRQRKNEAAVETIAQLSALFRLAIDRSGLQEIPLHQEIDFIRRYLEIERLRFGEKLRVEFAIEQTVLQALVPNIVLQPLVENSVKHGISRRTSPGLVRLSATRRDRRLHIEIMDEGPEGAEPEPVTVSRRTGIGLANTRAQLGKLYGENYVLDVRQQAGGHTIVTLDLPWRVAPAL